MRDNQGRELLVQPTTMRLAFAAIRVPSDALSPLAQTIMGSLRSRSGYRKVPSWTVTRRAQPKGRR